MLHTGLWFYDRMGGRSSLPHASRIDLARDPAGLPLKPEYRRGFEYSDCCVDDSRLVILNAVDAAERGASMNSRMRCVSVGQQDDLWCLRVQRLQTGDIQELRSRVLVNATGPWINQVLQSVLNIQPPYKVRLDKGSHIVVRRHFAHDRAYLLQNRDGRVVFAIPFQSGFTLIGTTEEDYRADPASATISQTETDYLLQSVNGYLRDDVSRNDIVWSYSGVRSLPERSGAFTPKSRRLSREYVLALDTKSVSPLLNVYGGKLTTYRALAEAALKRLEAFLPMRPPWTANTPLPGGDIPGQIEDFTRACAGEYPFLETATLRRMIAAYGTRMSNILGNARSAVALGKEFGCGLTEAELHYLAEKEWAETAEDVLWRRTKLGLCADARSKAELDAWFCGSRHPPLRAPGTAGSNVPPTSY